MTASQVWEGQEISLLAWQHRRTGDVTPCVMASHRSFYDSLKGMGRTEGVAPSMRVSQVQEYKRRCSLHDDLTGRT